jgi:4-alpha-glucanotransferase
MNALPADPGGPLLTGRRAEVLLHLGSLPSLNFDDAIRFLDFLEICGFSLWQMLPVGPSSTNGSPYSPYSAFAGDSSLLAREPGDFDPDAFQVFSAHNASWLEDFSLFSVIRNEQQGKAWWEWPDKLRDRDPLALGRIKETHSKEISRVLLQQFQFRQRWQDFRQSAADRGIVLIGDLPMFVTADSADVWANRQFFKLDKSGQASMLAGVPPDAFTDQGQCWGNPVYNWQAMADDGFSWWQGRLQNELERFDIIRWDHFRGLEAGWEIPAGTEKLPPVPADGAWCSVPGRDLLSSLQKTMGRLPVLAENLGVITTEVEDLRHDFGLPGMHVLQFAFDGDPGNSHLPAQHEINGVVYTGTHDNDTTRGWFESLDDSARNYIAQTLAVDQASIPAALTRAALDSRCVWAIFPMQDLLGLGSEARLNTPGEAKGQWAWRFEWKNIPDNLSRRWQRDLGRAGRQAA